MKAKLLQPSDVPDGCYRGLMTGHTMRFDHDGKSYYVQTQIGVRGINKPHLFKIVEGIVDQSSIVADFMGGIGRYSMKGIT